MNSDQTENKQEQEAAASGDQAESTPATTVLAEGEATQDAPSTPETASENMQVQEAAADDADAEDAAPVEPVIDEELAGLISEVADPESTGSLSGGGNASKITTPLPEAGGPPRPPLAEGATVNERYDVSSFLGSSGETNIYRVADLQGYMRCWACGAISSMPGDIYCVECGAQLGGRHYRLQEFRLPMADDDQYSGVDGAQSVDVGFLPQLRVAPAILENRVPGVAHAYDVWYDLELGRGYVAWEEAGGRVMLSWLPGMTNTGLLVPGQSGHLAVPQEPEEEQALGWMAQVGDLLVRLHSENIGGCSLELANLLVHPGDRVMLMDPSSCQSVEGLDDDAREALEKSDVRALAGELEQWYMAIRKENMPTPENDESADPFNVLNKLPRKNDQMISAYEATGPLNAGSNPAVVLAKAREGSYPTAEAFADILKDLYEASRPLNNLKLWSGRASDIGMVRKINEDSVLTLEATVLEHDGSLPVGLYVVADGMGGHQSGEVASSIAARTIGSMVNSSLVGPLVSGDPVARDPNTVALLLQQAVLEANRRISDLARERHSDLGTTVVAGILIGNQLTIANVGDSRAYLVRDGQVTVLTRDHSLVMQLVQAGQITMDDIYTHPRRNEIYRALGDARLTDTEVDIYRYRLRPGDGLLLCSDGLWDFVRDPDIAASVASPEDDPQTQANSLIAKANSKGGEDNISVIFAKLLQGEE
ncbi:MAG: PP2C family serine/threonine-protein phosphatase [Chloroflexia bacterium]